MSKHTKYVFINYLLPLILLSKNLQASHANNSQANYLHVNNLQTNNSHINKETITKIATINNILENQNLTTKESTCPEKQNLEVNYLQTNNSEIKIINSNIASLFGQQIIDGIKLIEKDQVLLTGQIDKEQNGLWIVQDAHWQRPENKNSIDTDLEFVSPNEQTNITKAGSNVTTAQDFTTATNIIKTASTGVDVVQSSVTIDNSNNISGINTISANSLPMPTTSVSSPAIKFPGTNTGIYSANSDTVSIGSQGSNIITFGTTGTNIPAGKNVTIDSPSTLSNTATFNGTTTFNGIINLNSTTNITNPATLSGTLNSLSGAFNINGTTNITGKTNLSGTTTTSGTTTLSGPLNITGATTISGTTNFLTNQINLSNGGSITAPAITFNGDTTSGFYSTTDSNISISASGLQQLNINATGINATGISMTGDINMNANNITGIGILSFASLNPSIAINTSSFNIDDPLNVTGSTILNGALNVTGLSTLGGGLSATGTVSLNGTINATGISMSGNINMNAKNITSANALNTTGAVLQPGTATLPSLTFTGNTGVGLSRTSANTLNICGGSTGINATVSPSGVSILGGGLFLSSSATIGASTNINLDNNTSLYIITSGTSITYSSGTSNPTGKIAFLANTTGSSITITASGVNVSGSITIPAYKCQILSCINVSGHRWIPLQAI